MVLMYSHDAKRFPHLANWLRSEFEDFVSNRLGWSEQFVAATRIPEEHSPDVLRGLSSSSGPIILFDALAGVYALFDKNDPNTIIVANKVADAFEREPTREEAARFTAAVIVHELVHWAMNSKNIEETGEAGEEFEKAVNGGKLFAPYWRDAKSRAAAFYTPSENDPRGISNNNPGNIIKSKVDWRGLANVDEMTSWQKKEKHFAVFSHAKWGIRAMSLNLQYYQNRRAPPRKTIEQMIETWAPREENGDAVDNYIAFVAGRMQIAQNQEFEFTEYARARPMIEAIITFENGIQPYSDALLDLALELSGVVKR